MADLQFDATTVAPSTGTPDAVPAGWYKAIISSSEMKLTKDQQGSYLAITYTIIESDFSGNKIFDNLNLRNQSVKAQEIAYATLSAICHATGVMQMVDSQQVHNIPMILKVSLDAAIDKYDASNSVKAIKSVSDPEALAKLGVASTAPSLPAVAAALPSVSQPMVTQPATTANPAAPAQQQPTPLPAWAQQPQSAAQQPAAQPATPAVQPPPAAPPAAPQPWAQPAAQPAVQPAAPAAVVPAWAQPPA